MKDLLSSSALLIGCIIGSLVTSCRTNSSDQELRASESSAASSPVSSPDEHLPGTRWQATYKWGFGGPLVELQRIDDEGTPTVPNHSLQLSECGTGPVIKCSNGIYRIDIKPSMRSAALTARAGASIQMTCASNQVNDIKNKPYVCTSP